MISSGASWICRLFSISVPDGFSTVSMRLFLSATTAMLLVLLLGPMFIRKLIELKVGQPIRDDKGFLLGELHKKKKDTPTMGGALIIISVLISSFLWADWSSFFVPLVLGTFALYGILGGFDDWAKLKSRSSKGLSGKFRLVIQTLIALAVVFTLAYPSVLQYLGFSTTQLYEPYQGYIYLPFITSPVCKAVGLLWLVIWGIQVFTMVGSANAVNLTDGLDGLATGCSFFVSIVLCMAALLSSSTATAVSYQTPYIQSSGEIAVMLAALAGACLGFLWFNAFPAQVFMGDTGSLAIGGMLGTSAVLLRREWLLALVGAIFVVETLSVMIQVVSFQRWGKRVFLCTPLHHHFEYAGLHEAKVVMRFWIVGLLLAVVGFLSLQM